jgi:hypothetical protein
MHSSRELSSQMFRFEEAGRVFASFADLCPGFQAQDRLGVVVREPLAATRSAALITAAVTAFYDQQRKESDDFSIYPDYFIFHAGCRAGDYSMFDIWPQHKCVSVDDSPDAVLRAVNDRGISILLLDQEDVGQHAERGTIEMHTRSSALSRLRHAFVRDAPGNADAINIKSNPVVERYVEHVIEATRKLHANRHGEARAWPRSGDNEVPTECYRRLSLEHALNCL